ncbi:MAG TPA: thiamine phosphate synthase, partial [Bacillota bacterium]|nr:thiamine phosphate synthase [Bacillota bacterium]
MPDKGLLNYSLYLITDRKVLGGKELPGCIEDAIKGGVTLVQLREKNINTFDYYNLALKVKKLVRKYGIP